MCLEIEIGDSTYRS